MPDSPAQPPAPAPAARQPRLELNVSSDPANLAVVRHACEAFCAAGGLDDAAVGEVGLCVNEAMANVTRHAYGGATDRPVTVTADWVGAEQSPQYPAGAVRVQIRDWGSGVNPAALPPKSPDPLQPGGLGLVCLRRMMDEVVFTPQPGGMLLTMVKKKESGVGSEGSGNDPCGCVP